MIRAPALYNNCVCRIYFWTIKVFFVYCDGSMPGSGGSSTASKKLSRALIFNCPFLFFLSFPFFDRVKVICTNVCNLSCLIVFGWLDPIGYCYTALLGFWALFPKQCSTMWNSDIISETILRLDEQLRFEDQILVANIKRKNIICSSEIMLRAEDQAHWAPTQSL